MSKLSVVLPAYNEELMVGKTCRVLAEVLTKAEIPVTGHGKRFRKQEKRTQM